MFAICDSTWKLNDCFYCNASMTESVFLFLRLFPKSKKIIVFRDLGSLRNINDFVFVTQLTPKKIRALIDKNNK